MNNKNLVIVRHFFYYLDYVFLLYTYSYFNFAQRLCHFVTWIHFPNFYLHLDQLDRFKYLS